MDRTKYFSKDKSIDAMRFIFISMDIHDLASYTKHYKTGMIELSK